MGFLSWIESGLDKIVPAVEVSARSRTRFTVDSLRSLMDYMASDCGLEPKSMSDRTYIMGLEGQTIGNLSQAKAIFGKATPEMYGTMKSRCRFVLSNDGTLEITSYEHLMGMTKEREAFREVLAKRLELVMKVAEDEGQNNQPDVGDA